MARCASSLTTLPSGAGCASSIARSSRPHGHGPRRHCDERKRQLEDQASRTAKCLSHSAPSRCGRVFQANATSMCKATTNLTRASRKTGARPAFSPDGTLTSSPPSVAEIPSAAHRLGRTARGACGRHSAAKAHPVSPDLELRPGLHPQSPVLEHARANFTGANGTCVAFASASSAAARQGYWRFRTDFPRLRFPRSEQPPPAEALDVLDAWTMPAQASTLGSLIQAMQAHGISTPSSAAGMLKEMLQPDQDGAQASPALAVLDAIVHHEVGRLRRARQPVPWRDRPMSRSPDRGASSSPPGATTPCWDATA